MSCVFPLNWPNVLTVVRILLVPVLVVALLGSTPDGDVFAAIVFAVASLTDFVDGYLARSRDSVTTFGKLMDPLADKLLIVAALISLVSLHRLAAWVAMVIIARELAVTVLRDGRGAGGRDHAGEQFRQAEDVRADRGDPRADRRPRPPGWARAAGLRGGRVTVASGLDYFFGLRRRLARRTSAASAASARSRGVRDARELRRARRGLVCRGASCRPPSSPRSSPSVPWRSATHVVLMDRLEVLLARGDERRRPGMPGRRSTTPPIISRTQSSTKRGRRWAFSTTADLVDALHQLVDLR